MTKKPEGYWNLYENIKKEALRYETRSDFQRGCASACRGAVRNGWYEEMCEHMPQIRISKDRAIYAYLFEDGSFYVGLTWDYRSRKTGHKNNSSSSIYSKLKSHRFGLIEYGVFLTEKEAQLEEEATRVFYRSMGLEDLGKATSGALGGSGFLWSLDSIFETAGSCETISEFRENCTGAYMAARRLGIYHILAEGLGREASLPHSKKDILEEGKKYTRRNDFRKGSPSIYSKAATRGWLEEACAHMPRYPAVRHTKEAVLKVARKHPTKAGFYTEDLLSYAAAVRNKWLEEACAHMPVRAPSKTKKQT